MYEISKNNPSVASQAHNFAFEYSVLVSQKKRDYKLKKKHCLHISTIMTITDTLAQHPE